MSSAPKYRHVQNQSNQNIMNKTISIIRLAILFALGFFAIILLFGEEQDENMWAFTLHMIADKTLALTLFYGIGRLYNRWSKIDPWIMACDKLCDDIMDNPNPNKI